MAVEKFATALPFPDDLVDRSTTFDTAVAMLRDLFFEAASREGDVLRPTFQYELKRAGTYTHDTVPTEEYALICFGVDVRKADG